jgi:alkylation response protein AidB-like acyl-CoA dehydrogenase
MDFQLSDEQLMIQESVRRFCTSDYDFEQRRVLHNSAEGFSRAHWHTFAELGWLGIALPEAVGGFGGSMEDEAIVMEEFGRALVLEPYLSCVIYAARVVLAAGTAAQSETLLAPVIAGEKLLALAHSEPAARGRVSFVETAAQADGQGGYRLNGFKSLVLGGPSADTVIVSARTAGAAADRDGITLFAIDAASAGIERRDYRMVDGIRVADITLRDVQVGADSVLGVSGTAFAALDLATNHAILALCAEALGAMDRALWMTRDYLKTRKQYGVTLNTFQALQHRMADMLVELEQTRSMLYQGFAALTQTDPELRRKGVSATKVQIGRSGQFIGGNAIQLHGGIGVTDEFIVGHLFKRLTTASLLFGNTDFHLQQFASL